MIHLFQIRKLIPFLLISFLLSCQSKKEIKTAPVTSDKIQLSSELISNAGIQFQKITALKYRNSFQCKAYSFIPENRKSLVTVPIEGKLVKLLKKEGSYVKTGDDLAILEQASLLNLQRDYVKLKAQHNYYSEEYRRQGSLSFDRAVPMKKMQKAQSDFESLEAEIKALEAQLRLYGISPSSLEQGFVSKIRVKAKQSGYLHKWKAIKGQYIRPQQSIAEIIENYHPSVKLEIPQKYYPALDKNSKVELKIKGFKNRLADFVSKTNTAEMGYFEAIVKPDRNKDLIAGMIFKADVFLSDSSQRILVPQQAVFKKKSKHYIFLKDNKYLRKVKVKRGIKKGSYVEIKSSSEVLLNKELVINGVDYLKKL